MWHLEPFLCYLYLVFISNSFFLWWGQTNLTNGEIKSNIANTGWLSYFYPLFLTGSPATLHSPRSPCRTPQNHLVYWVHRPSPNGYTTFLFCYASSAFLGDVCCLWGPLEVPTITNHMVFYLSLPEQCCAKALMFWSSSALPNKYCCTPNISDLLSQQDQPAFSAHLGRIPPP